MASDLDGRALDEAAARAMGWTCSAEGFWRDRDGAWMDRDTDGPEPTESDMMPFLHKRGRVVTESVDGHVDARLWWNVEANRPTPEYEHGTDLREALARLVVAVAAREATDGK